MYIYFFHVIGYMYVCIFSFIFSFFDFRYFDIRKYSCCFFISSNETLSSEKNNTKIIEIGLSSFDSMVISQNIVIVNFLFILVTFQ